MEKIIHQFWEGNNGVISEEYFPQVWMDSWKTENTDWEYRLWNWESCLRMVDEFYPQHSDDCRLVQRYVTMSDVCRLLALHRFGGVYADLDCICLKPMDRLIDSALLLLRQERDAVTIMSDGSQFAKWPRLKANAWMYSDPGNWALERVIRDGAFHLANVPGVEFSAQEEVFGTARMGWLDHAVGREAGFEAIHHSLVCPRIPLHESGSAETFAAWKDIAALKVAAPSAFVMNVWRGSWCGSRFSQNGVASVIPGS